ncbi:hypothetical protein L7F22_010700 [Adiantum nelumboides]|nr:hypothetical protein [Adiantum nelumboides]
MDELSNILARVNIKFPTFKGLSTEDANDHARRFVSLCKGRGLNWEDAYLVLFPSTLDNLADKWYSQFQENHFTEWETLRQQFCEAFRPGDFQEKVLDELGNLSLQPNETFAELMTKSKALVAKLPQKPGDFMVKKWVEKALPKVFFYVISVLQSQQEDMIPHCCSLMSQWMLHTSNRLYPSMELYRYGIYKWRDQWITKLQECFTQNKHSLQMLQLPKSFSTCSSKEAYLLEYIRSYQRRWQRADCFDFAVVLVSFLAGAGYEAYCVVGYAPLHITTNSQEAIVCPYIALKDKEEKETHQDKENHSLTQKLPKVANINYIYDAPPALNGEYLEAQKHERDIQATSFVRSFKDTYDCDLRMGENEEEDNLFLYCKERPPPHILTEVSKQLQPQQQTSINIDDAILRNPYVQSKASSQAKNPDIFDKKRLHCWVLVTSNKRDVPDFFFLEPSTGHRFELQTSPYQGVEYIWNQHNIFINMQLNANTPGIENMSWELKDTSKWERVLDTFLSAGDLQASIPVTKPSTNTVSPSKSQGVHVLNTSAGSLNGTDASKVDGGFLSGNSVTGSTESDPVLSSKSAIKAGATVGILKRKADKVSCEDPAKNGFTKPYHWLLPASWVTQLKIPMEAYVTRCPKGVKKTHYYRCTHELYSFYGDFVRWDGLIERIILYEDDERTNVVEIHDYFQRRKDGLRKRIFIPGANKVHDFFDPGASFGLKETEIIEGHSRKFLFYADARTDGLNTRDEVIGEQIVESFINHEACLVYRCASYGPPLPPPKEDFSPKPLSDRHLESANETHGEASVKGSLSRPGSVRLSSRHGGRMSVDSQKTRSRSRIMSRWQGSSSNRRKNSTPTSDKQHEKKLLPAPRRRPVAEKLLPIIKITQKYEIRSDASPKDNVAKHAFKLSINQIKVDYHHVNRHITANSRVYNKDGSLNLIHVDPFTSEQSQFDKLDEFNSLILAEREAIKSVRDTEREIEETLQQRLREEQNVVLITPYIDIACVKEDDLSQEGEDAIKVWSESK